MNTPLTLVCIYCDGRSVPVQFDSVLDKFRVLRTLTSFLLVENRLFLKNMSYQELRLLK